MALRTGFLTVITLGLYRFWMKTRLRRWYWSAIRIGGTPLEYVGDPIEKLLGFLIAVVILAFYIGIVNLLLMFASFSLFQGNTIAYLVSLAGVVPLWFYAQYRARRYVLARTRWRGLRFGLEPGAWGYAARALWHWALTILTAGLLWPRMTFWLEKYRTDRTSYGTERLVQDGRWQMLYPATKWLFLGFALAAATAGAAVSGNLRMSFGLGFAAAAVLAYGLVYYRVETLRRLTATKRLGDLRLTVDPSPRRILFIHVFGYLLAGLAASIPLGALGLVLVAAQSVDTLSHMGVDGDLAVLSGIDRWVIIAFSVAVYFAVFLLWSALTHALITMPVTRHYAETLRIDGTEGLRSIRQRPRDEHIEAEGFAEALDVGASI
ncbi:DUF898 domain-containing protein [Thalassococcus sp. CAU 1522]|uniref:DUF898 domain-containing protein n=1 Tax=Thalassococcus arenae TaxID=2851652 RepID=A0ABS6N715_9RHOB|nr:DUF898 domain-containing protein [Thalassococcus arenae]